MNISLDTLEIHSVELPAWNDVQSQIHVIVALLTIALPVFIISTIVKLIWTFKQPTAPSAQPYIAVDADCEL